MPPAHFPGTVAVNVFALTVDVAAIVKLASHAELPKP